MSILIKNLDMPKNCMECMFWARSVIGVDRCFIANKELPCDCPLVEVPTPHGRLIDADALKEHFPHDEDWDYPVNTHSLVCETIDNAPTIIESEE